jgi:hypothetical protein
MAAPADVEAQALAADALVLNGRAGGGLRGDASQR